MTEPKQPLPPSPDASVEEFRTFGEEARKFMKETLGIDSAMELQKTSCGSCTVCCDAPSISSKTLEADGDDHLIGEKAACVQCIHSRSGCAIYDKRPMICKEYFCHYALGETDVWPKDTGVAFSLQVNPESGEPLAIGHALDSTKAIFDERVQGEIVRCLETGYSVVTIKDDKMAYQFRINQNMIQCEIDQSDPTRDKFLFQTIRERPEMKITAELIEADG